MRKLLTYLGSGWAILFIGVTLGSASGSQVSGTGETEWQINFGIPAWLGVEGWGKYPGVWKGILRGQFGWSIPHFFAATAIVSAPLIGCIVIMLLRKGHLRVHLSTALFLLIAGGVLIWLNVMYVQGIGSQAWGWPLRNDKEPSVYITVIADVSLAFTIIIGSALLLEWNNCRKCTGCGGPGDCNTDR